MKAIQDFYPEESAICYGCGRNNQHGHHIRTFWDGKIGTATFKPEDYHTAFPGIVYGGVLASLIDCHSMGTAIAAYYDRQGIPPSVNLEIACVTGNLNVRFLKPTPIGFELSLKSTITEITDRKAIVACSIFANDIATVTAEVIAVRVPSRNPLNK